MLQNFVGSLDLWDSLMSLWTLIVETWHTTPGSVKTIITAAFGTIIGAWLTSRAQTKRRVLDELKAVRAARTLCFSITNKAFAMKRQHIRSMKLKFDSAVTAHREYQANPVGPFVLSLDLQALSQVKFPGDVLERIAFEKCSLDSEALALVVALSSAIDDLKNSIDLRNDLVVEFREKQPMSEKEKIELYLGAAGSGIIDTRFANNIEALAHQVDDCIFFSMRLADKLLARGKTLRRSNAWRFRLDIPKFQPFDWSIAREADLIPPDAPFADWLRAFKVPPSRWDRLRARFQRNSETCPRSSRIELAG